MRKKLQKKAVTLATSLRKHIKLNTIFPFQEKPSVEAESISREKTDGDSTKQLAAAELFSLFTADIIKEEVVFTR
jgi:hypothetical protein